MRSLTNKVAFITGASSGIGRALALELSSRGVSVVLAARRIEKLKELAGEVERGGGQALAVECDVTSEVSTEKAVAEALARFGQLDLVFANAGFGVVGPFDKLSIADFQRQFDTNVFGVLRTVKATLPALKKTRGSLVLIGSVMGYVSTPHGAPYPMSKFAVRALAESLYPELAREGVHVLHVAPGLVQSEIHQVDNLGRLHERAKHPPPKWLEMPAATAARQIVGATVCRRREIVVTLHGKVLVFIANKMRWLLHMIVPIAAGKRRPPTET